VKKTKENKGVALSEHFISSLRGAIAAHGGQGPVAEKAGMSQSMISRLLNGRNVRVATLVRLLEALGGGLENIDRPAPAIAAETHATFKAELAEAKIALADKTIELAQQQDKIVRALTIVCKEQGLTSCQAHAVQAAVFNYEAVLAGTHTVGYAEEPAVGLPLAASD